MDFTSSELASYILYKGKLADHRIDKNQLQGILYCCYGAVLAKFDDRLTSDHPKAWPFGPLFVKTVSDINHKRLTVRTAKNFIERCNKDVMLLINQTIETFWIYTGRQMINWTCIKQGPWYKTDPLESIDDREIQKFFEKYLTVIQHTNIARK